MLSDDVIAFLRSRPIAMVATRDAQNRPAEHECMIVEVTPAFVIGLVPTHLARNLEQNVADNGSAALVCSRQPGDHRSVQMKGRITHVGPAPTHLREQYRAAAFEPLQWWLPTIVLGSTAEATLDRMVSQPLLEIRLEVRDVFDQTPGPRAGRPIGVP